MEGRTSHYHAHTSNQSNEFRLDAVWVGAGAKCRIEGSRWKADACEEAVVGEDGEGVCEEAEDVDEIA